MGKESILISPGYDALKRGFCLGDLRNAAKEIEPILESDGCFWGGLTPAMTYLVGVRQGIHNERMRRKGVKF